MGIQSEYAQRTQGRAHSKPGFRSFKTIGAIRYKDRWARDALIQATLRPGVAAISQAAENLSAAEGASLAFETVELGQRRLYVLCNNAPERSDAPRGFESVLYLARETVLREPHLSIQRAIWSRRGLHIPPSLLVSIVSQLSTQENGLTLAELQPGPCPGDHHLLDYVMTMACVGIVDLHWSNLLNNETIVALRSLKHSK